MSFKLVIIFCFSIKNGSYLLAGRLIFMAEERIHSSQIALNTVSTEKNGSALNFIDALSLLWRKKITLLLFVCGTFVLGTCYAMWVRPQYTSDVLLQVNVKGSSSKATKAMGEMGAVIDLASPADAEIELIKSRMVLSYVVAAEHMHLKAFPRW